VEVSLMGIDVGIYMKHTFFEKNITYTLEKLKEISSFDVLISSMHTHIGTQIGPEWVVNIDDYNSVEECFEREKYITITRRWDTEKETEIWFSKNNFEMSGNEFMIRGRWYYFSKFLIGDMNEEDFEDYKNWFNNFLENLIEYGKLFNSNELIMFCGDLNQDIEEELWTGETIENILNKNIWTIITDIPYKIDFNNYEEYDIPRFLFNKKWKNNLFDINKWKNLFE
jgi:hypothetical protein